ncbi:hypothetical protein PTSG_05748 [Salpingoeca rosetta]|uniref:Uncharacterized protein n=1 Tax=Salpingoeca rosetta (strain ATCC 50818 / BSB-021) TaxID=946362 RepID=F2UB43_SALR5|nr:uncharacterized protein PTSG_05748 [Salpingoeca rosetta]EGD74056.1 hypothetical protein PTSG_05748 [Salpingoeca rosetta]|eukprot:XP_004993618.1 hypothetical protein PTSG_05748 [Salpingoeca rosetta]
MAKKSSSGRSSARPRKTASTIVDEAKEPSTPAEPEEGEEKEDVFVDPDTEIPGVPPPPEQLPRTLPASARLFTILQPTSDEGVYLKEKLWPTLELALDKLILAIKYHIPRDIRQQYEDPSMAFTKHPEHAVNFNPIDWLGTFLKRHNPYNPPALTHDQAAARIQAAFRGSQVRKMYKVLREEARRKKEEEDLARRREAAALRIQAAYRGHSVRLELATGRLHTRH